MPVGVVASYELFHGKREEFTSAAHDTAELYESLGARTSFRQVLVGGERSGNVAFIAQFRTSTDRGRFTDAIRKPENQARNTLLQKTGAGRSENPIASLVSRWWVDSVPANDAELPPVAEVQTRAVYRVLGGNFPAARDALLEAVKVRIDLGIRCGLNRISYGGEAPIQLNLTSRFDSFEQMAEGDSKLAAWNETHVQLITRAAAAGWLTQTNSSISTRLQV